MELLLGTASKKTQKKDYGAVIIGGGPAGLTAGIYLGRAKVSTLILEKLVPGGLAGTTERIENYPGFPDGIDGRELTSRMEKQALNYGVDMVLEEVIDIDLVSQPKVIKTTDGEFTGKGVIIATGTSPKRLNIPGEDRFHGKGISYCATCDAPFFQDKDVVVIGCGNSGLQEGIYLKRFARHITFVEFLPHMTAEKVLQERARSLSGVEFLLYHEVISFEGDDKLTGVKVRNRETGEEKVIKCDGVFIYAGLIPNTGFLKGKLEMDEAGFIITDGELRTNIEGVFAAGDVRSKYLRQVATAVGDGAVAAKKLEKYLGG